LIAAAVKVRDASLRFQKATARFPGKTGFNFFAFAL